MCWTLDANDAQAARTARKAATAALRAHTSDDEVLAAAELIVGELLSNAARHARGHACLELGVADGLAEISVHDTSPNFNFEIRRPLDQFSESGRGLYIVSELARSVTVVPREGFGKRVTVLLDLSIAKEAHLEGACTSTWLREADRVCTRPRIALYQPQTRPNGAA